MKLGDFDSASLGWLSEPAKYDCLLRSIPVNNRLVVEVEWKDIDSVEWTMLLSNGYVERVFHKPKAFVRLWGVEEEVKSRRRLIVHPKQINDQLQYSSEKKVLFPSYSAIRDNILSAAAVVEVDMKCWFYQIELGASVRKYFGVCRDGLYYVFCRLPMGFSLAPAIATNIAVELARRAWGASARIAVVIDNIYLFMDHPEQIEDAKSAFNQVAARVGATIGKIEGWSTQGTILGVTYDLRGKTANVTDRFLAKYDAFMSKVWGEMTHPPESLWRFCAILIFAILAKGKFLGAHLEIVKLMGRLGRAIPADSEGAPLWSAIPMWTVTPSQHRRLRAAIAEIWASGPAKIARRQLENDGEVYTDAATGSEGSETGGVGVVIVKRNGEVIVRSWVVERQNINILEMEALVFGAEQASALGLQNPRFHVDSSAVFHQVKGGMAGPWSANGMLMKILTRYPSLDINLIKSAENPADEPSRSALRPSNGY